jgi:phospho-N-acetylmuramoyl-pentapeptide-transferase
MGDTGALMLGALLAGVAVLSNGVLLLPLVGGVLVLEVLSDVVQVASFRLTGRRVLRMAPLHHHLELSGWSEERIVTAFWVASAVLALAAWR